MGHLDRKGERPAFEGKASEKKSGGRKGRKTFGTRQLPLKRGRLERGQLGPISNSGQEKEGSSVEKRQSIGYIGRARTGKGREKTGGRRERLFST